jgi:hypothetical protein
VAKTDQGRIEPTAEDMIVFERNLKRMMRWVRANPPPRTREGALSITGNVKRFANDYVETEGNQS